MFLNKMVGDYLANIWQFWQLSGFFSDRQIADSLVYELYFKEKFAEDGLYPAPKGELAEALAEHLKPISYDHYVQLYWQAQLESALSAAESE